MSIELTDEPTLAVIGAGPKAAAIAAKAAALSACKKGNIKIIVFDQADIASHWKGHAGFTTGQSILGTPPEKDVGFPYDSIYGATVDQEMLKYSWSAYLVSLPGAYADWVDRGGPHPRHEMWGNYLQWVLAAANPELHTFTTVVGIQAERNAFIISTRAWEGEKQHRVSGVVFTGPGKPNVLKENTVSDDSEDVVDGRKYFRLVPVFEKMPSGRIAVIGGGETAASVALSIIEINPNLAVEILNRSGALFSRGESFFENQLYSSAEGWRERSLESREEIIARTDHGVFSVDAMNRLAFSRNVSFQGGEIEWIGRTSEGIAVRFKGREHEFIYDKVIVATGFDPWSPLDLLDLSLRPTVADRSHVRLKIDHHLRMPANSENDSPVLNVHVPMLAGISQGPGFPNLSCLGLLADRILSAYCSPPGVRP